MDERAALELLGKQVAAAGNDGAAVDGLVISTDMLHAQTDFPDGVTRYTAGWRAIAASLSDIAAMGGDPIATVAAYGAPEFAAQELRAFVNGASAVSASVDAAYVGGDLDQHPEFTVATTAVARAERPLGRDGATPGDRVFVTGRLGRSAAALRLFAADAIERANDLFRFEPRVAMGRQLIDRASAVIDSSDGLARSVHQLAEASGCGFVLDGDAIPVHDAVTEVAKTPADRLELAVYFGEDFELVFTLPSAIELPPCSVPVTEIGRVVESGLRIDGDPLPNRGYVHGGDSQPAEP